MEIIKTSSEAEMILEFLKGEYSSNRFNKKLKKALNKIGIKEDIITNGILSKKQNELRKKIMKEFRGYPDKKLFYNFPKIDKWEFVRFDEEDIDNIYYINYDYWNLLSDSTSSPKKAAINIKNGIEIFGVSNEPFILGSEYLENNKFPPIILITCNSSKYLIIEGHSRMSIYGMKPEKFTGSYGYIGYCQINEMKKYDSRMIS